MLQIGCPRFRNTEAFVSTDLTLPTSQALYCTVSFLCRYARDAAYITSYVLILVSLMTMTAISVDRLLRDRSISWNYIGDGEIRVSHHLLKLSPYIQFVAGESLGSLWVLWIFSYGQTFYRVSLKILYKLSICLDTIPSNYRPKKRHVYFTY